jgi:hypothetical protein
MFHLTSIPAHVNDVIFGETSEINEEALATNLPASVKVGWYFLWTIVPAALLWWRYRRLTP